MPQLLRPKREVVKLPLFWHSPDHKKHKLFKNGGFKSYRGKVRIDNVIFNSIVRVGVARFGDVFYDINLEVAEYLPHTTNSSASDMNMATSVNSIPQKSDLSTDSAKINFDNDEGQLSYTPPRTEAGMSTRELLANMLDSVAESERESYKKRNSMSSGGSNGSNISPHNNTVPCNKYIMILKKCQYKRLTSLEARLKIIIKHAPCYQPPTEFSFQSLNTRNAIFGRN